MKARAMERLANARTIHIDEPDYPAPLRDLSSAPRALRMLGRLEADPPAVTIVGTRAASEEGLAFAERLAADLVGAGVVVVSGGAHGIDAAAHHGALSARGRTVVVLGGGLGHPYPAGHAPLFHQVVERGGALLSEHADLAPVSRSRLVARNRLLAALGRAVVVVQAPARSGALSTAAFARRLGRPVLAVPGAPWDPRAEGCLALLRSGATVCTSAADVLSVATRGAPPSTGWAPASGIPMQQYDGPARPLGPADEESRAVLHALRSRSLGPDDLAAATGISPGRLLGLLGRLHVEGWVTECSGGRWSRAHGNDHG
ncbi:MAG: DNA-processing protein DprA [Myxococcota bacterium]|nr:DNA-processing protein DprA [Myxococcota bacterium]MDW8363910.1 DNA-processing protein DprA [Myxococcales bacterium]